ncbi:hypothetical protein BC939DRAFT_506876 [Gamsiella multidivaricata]|uniref:uncharacterized protein n=1 Tax=Gamsiella multidivaricata TaxID=101098 RepID=UPI002220A0E1|nr:uncharacterized protein BC939DRAFT_506876 [Gamsiella multidivaricata]KAI7818021.1 hypothetical protein BC939DRAFT_506876 [Gamsiella multidivaricata]
MSLPNNGTNGTPVEATIDVLMTTPETTPEATAPTILAVATSAAEDTLEPVPDVTPLRPQPAAMEDPKTVATRQKVIDIIDHQFDLEILLRHAESAAIARELAKTERMLEDLRHAILSERQGSPYGNSTVSRTFGNQNQQQNPYYSSRQSSRRTTAYYGRDVRQPEALYAVRADGQFVRLGCPRCDRYDFGSIQGLINHMRLSHKLVFKNTEEGVRYCGIVVPSSEVPLDHPCRTKIVFSSLGTSDVNQGQPTIKTYDEEVDLDSDDGHSRDDGLGVLSQAPRRTSNASVNSSSNAGSESDSDTSDVISGGESGLGAGKRRRSSLALSIVRPQKGTPRSKSNMDSESDGTEEDSESETSRPRHAGKGPMRKYGSMSQRPQSMTPIVDTRRPAGSSRLSTVTPYSMPESRMSSATSSRAVSPAFHPLMNENDYSEPSTPVSGYPAATIPMSSPHPPVAARNSVATASDNTFVMPSVAAHQPGTQYLPQQSQQLQPTIISFNENAIQAGLPAPLDTIGSRFYVKRRIVVGNVSKYLPEDKRDPRLKEFPYKWMIYVDGTPKPEDITAYVFKVEFHLHESYRPNHIVTVSAPPFHLSRYAWGETQIKVRLFFHDARNKPVEVYHRLALDPTHCGRQVHGRERHVDLELDRHTTFLATVPLQTRSKSSNNISESRNNLILNSAAEVAMADGAEEDEQELQHTLSKPSTASVHGHGGAGTGADASGRGGAGVQNGSEAAVVDTVRAASMDEGSVMKRKSKETTLLYCKACGSLWKQHREGALGVAGAISEPVLLNEDDGQRIPNCPHHPQYYAVKDVEEDEQMLLSLLVGRSRNKFALDMLKNCGIVDQNGRPLSSHDRMMMEMQMDSTMDLDIGDSELPITPMNLASTLSLEHQAKVQQLTDALQRMEVYKCRRSEIDWVLSVMDELKLKTLLLDGGAGGGSGGSRSGLRERDQEQEQLLNTAGLANVPESMSQKAVVGGLLVQATKAFLGSLLSKAVQIHRAEAEAEKGPESIMMELDALHDPAGEEQKATSKEGVKVLDKLLTPYHVYQALQSNPEELDFLTSQYEDMEGIGEMMAGL